MVCCDFFKFDLRDLNGFILSDNAVVSEMVPERLLALSRPLQARPFLFVSLSFPLVNY